MQGFVKDSIYGALKGSKDSIYVAPRIRLPRRNQMSGVCRHFLDAPDAKRHHMKSFRCLGESFDGNKNPH
jgi:hypothetical protein